MVIDWTLLLLQSKSKKKLINKTDILLYHFTSKVAYNSFLEKGYHTCFSHYIDDELYKEAYNWMIMQMHTFLPAKNPLAGDYPLWAWYKYNLNTFEHGPGLFDLYPEGSVDQKDALTITDESVRLTIKININQVLLSDFDKWWFPLSDTYWCADEEAYSHDYIYQYSRREREISWSRSNMFIQPFNPLVYTGSFPIQGTFWYFDTKMVQDVRFYDITKLIKG